MKSLLVINSSGRVARSITRHLTARFAAGWSCRKPDRQIISRDVGLRPPATVNEAWIAAAYIDPASSTPAMRAALHQSETLIAEIARVDTVVIGAPMHNFGMPAQLKAYFDQVVRVGRTFAFEATADEPYRPLLIPRPVVIITSAGDGAFHAGGGLEHLNFFEPHLKAILGFMGLTEVSLVRAGHDEFQDDRTRRSLASAEAAAAAGIPTLMAEVGRVRRTLSAPSARLIRARMIRLVRLGRADRGRLPAYGPSSGSRCLVGQTIRAV